MTTFERIKLLAKNQGKSLNRIEEELGYGKNVLYRLKDSNPSVERLEEIADYFDVTVDYLLGRTDEISSKTPSDEEYSDLIMMFRKGEKTVPEYKKEDYRKQVKNLMNFIAQSMDEDDDE
ncbi:helix-turn-helix domain-containing protein [Enterococcus sp. UD-01]|jgi:transcriptional regulator with XRE-family HTH domain|uniref:helix-turn-helix domain-containing protein n=1 Tax=Enterococcus sp. UD-01 TaxID=3373911 RepID=UPI003835D2CE